MRKITTFSTVLTSGGATYSRFETGPNPEVLTAYLEKGYLYIVYVAPEFYVQEEKEEVTVMALDPYTSYSMIVEDEMKFLCSVEEKHTDINTKITDNYGYQDSNKKVIEITNFVNRLLVFWKSRRMIGEIVGTQMGILDEN